MILAVADTHAALWYLFGDPRLSARAKTFIDQAAAGRSSIEISPISVAEIVYLIEKNRLPASAFDDLRTALDNPNHVFNEAPFTSEGRQGHAAGVARRCSRHAGQDRSRDGRIFRGSRYQPRR